MKVVEKGRFAQQLHPNYGCYFWCGVFHFLNFSKEVFLVNQNLLGVEVLLTSLDDTFKLFSQTWQNFYDYMIHFHGCLRCSKP